MSSLFFKPIHTCASAKALICPAVTVTVKEQLCPPGSLQVTAVAPTGKTDPDGGVHVTGPQLPAVVGSAYVTVALHWPGAFGTVTSSGQMIVHPEPATVTVNSQVSVLDDESVTVQVTVLIPVGNAEPEGGSHANVTQLPVAVGSAYTTVAKPAP
jgi:hypothetical protein